MLQYRPAGPPVNQPGRVVARAIRAWPNPFSNSVRFNLNPGTPGTPNPILSIFDNSGRAVRTLTGSSWDGRDQSGRLVSPGIYFCRIGTGDTQSETKLVLTR
jgi:hypothetical protein